MPYYEITEYSRTLKTHKKWSITIYAGGVNDSYEVLTTYKNDNFFNTEALVTVKLYNVRSIEVHGDAPQEYVDLLKAYVGKSIKLTFHTFSYDDYARSLFRKIVFNLEVSLIGVVS